MYIAPKRLRVGDVVAIIAPASSFKTDELVEGLDVIKEAGLRPVLGPNVKRLKSLNIRAASVRDRVNELMWAFSDPSISGVIVATGGNGSAECLPYLDYALIAQGRRPLLGMSDISALNNGILAKANLISINGQSPNIRLDEGERNRESDSASLQLALELMMSDQEWSALPFAFNEYLPRTVCPGRAQGYVVGCNNDTFVHLLGTAYMPDLHDTILFIEDTHKSGEVLSRQFIHMQLAGVFDQIAGIVIGEFADVPDRTSDREPSIEDVLSEYLGNGVPCVYGYSFSHGPLTSPIPVGALCEMDADEGTVEFKFTMG